MNSGKGMIKFLVKVRSILVGWLNVLVVLAILCINYYDIHIENKGQVIRF